MTVVLQVSEDHSARNTGITAAVDQLIRHVAPALKQELLCTGTETIPIPEGVKVTLLECKGLSQVWRMASSQRQSLQTSVNRASVIHLHGVWMWPQWAAARAAHQRSLPFILTSHGMLEAYMWNQKGWAQLSKKTLYWRLVAYPAFRHASIIHALTPREADSLKSYFPGQCIEMIPNGLDLGEIDRLLSNVSNSASEINPYFLFVGRIHPKKGLHLLIEAFSRLSSHHVKLLIAGPVQDHTLKYAQELEANVKRYNLQDRVKFLGSVQGEQKWRLFREAWAFCLPSYSEGLATVNLEAAAAQTPVITTPESGVVESWSNHGGVFCSPDVEAVTAALEQALSWTITERNERGAQLRKLIENHYSWEAIIPQWLSIYQDLSEHNG